MRTCKWCAGVLFEWFGKGGRWTLCWRCDTTMVPVFGLDNRRLPDVMAGPPRLLRQLRGGE